MYTYIHAQHRGVLALCSQLLQFRDCTINKLYVDFKHLFEYQTNSLTFSDLMNTLYPIRYVNLKYKTELTLYEDLIKIIIQNVISLQTLRRPRKLFLY